MCSFHEREELVTEAKTPKDRGDVWINRIAIAGAVVGALVALRVSLDELWAALGGASFVYGCIYFVVALFRGYGAYRCVRTDPQYEPLRSQTHRAIAWKIGEGFSLTAWLSAYIVALDVVRGDPILPLYAIAVALCGFGMVIGIGLAAVFLMPARHPELDSPFNERYLREENERAKWIFRWSLPAVVCYQIPRLVVWSFRRILRGPSNVET